MAFASRALKSKESSVAADLANDAGKIQVQPRTHTFFNSFQKRTVLRIHPGPDGGYLPRVVRWCREAVGAAVFARGRQSNVLRQPIPSAASSRFGGRPNGVSKPPFPTAVDFTAEVGILPFSQRGGPPPLERSLRHLLRSMKQSMKPKRFRRLDVRVICNKG
jgi:hypothetical protein